MAGERLRRRGPPAHAHRHRPGTLRERRTLEVDTWERAGQQLGLETAAAFSVVGAIVAELPFGSPDGLGVVILTSWQFYIFQPEALYCVALAACSLGAVFVLGIRSMAYFSLGSRSQGEVL